MEKMKRHLFVAGAALAGLALHAQEAAVDAVSEKATVSMRQIITQGGPLMYPIIILSFLAVCLIIFYLLTLRRNLLFPKKFLDGAEEIVLQTLGLDLFLALPCRNQLHNPLELHKPAGLRHEPGAIGKVLNGYSVIITHS